MCLFPPPFPLHEFFRDNASPPLIGLVRRYFQVPKPGNLTSDVPFVELIVYGRKRREVEVGFIGLTYVGQHGRFLERHPVDVFLFTHRRSLNLAELILVEFAFHVFGFDLPHKVPGW